MKDNETYIIRASHNITIPTAPIGADAYVILTDVSYSVFFSHLYV